MRPFAKGSRLSFPTGAARGFDPSHLANRSIGPIAVGSFVAVPGATFLCLNTPVVPTKFGAATFAMTAIGPTHLSSGSNQGCSFALPQAAVTTPLGCTNAAIIMPQSSQTTGDTIIQPGASGAATNRLALNALVPILNNSNTVSSGITLALNVPYFVAVSGSGAASGPGQYNWVIVNLQTGGISTAVNNATTSGVQAFFSPWFVGGNSGNFQTTGVRVAAAMCSTAKLSLAELLIWAADPWAYWYPQRDKNFVGVVGGTVQQNIVEISQARQRASYW